MDAPVQAGSPRSPEAAERLAEFQHRTSGLLVLAAVLPLVVVPEPGQPVGVAVGVLSWLVFVADLLASRRWRSDYLATRMGRFDLAIVVLTSPWYLIPGANAGAFVVLLRVARLARVVVAAAGARRLIERLGRVVIVAGLVVTIASALAYQAERATNDAFASMADSLWWGYVTLTTVGYGDITPHTSVGRWAGVLIMTAGIAVLGVLSGSLASFLGVAPEPDGRGAAEGQQPASESASSAMEVSPSDLAALTREVQDLRREIRTLGRRLEAIGPDDPGAPGEGT